jgi:hypothetical protein
MLLARAILYVCQRLLYILFFVILRPVPLQYVTAASVVCRNIDIFKNTVFYLHIITTSLIVFTIYTYF